MVHYGERRQTMTGNKRLSWDTLVASVTSVLLLVAAVPAFATSVFFEPNAQTRLLGEQATVDIVVNAPKPAGLGAYDFVIYYNPTILSLANVTVNNGPGNAVLGTSLGTSPADFILTAGSINIFDVSLEAPADLALIQPDTFVLGTLTFNTLSIGTSPLTIADAILGDMEGNRLVADFPEGSITVAASSVPEPGTIVLIAVGVVGMIFLRKRSG